MTANVCVICVLTFSIIQPTASNPISVEQTSPGRESPATVVASFDGLGAGFAGDYLKKNETNYSSRIGAFQIPDCVGPR